VSLTLALPFLILKDLIGKRLAGRLTQLRPDQTTDITRKNSERNAIAAASAAAVWAAVVVNRRDRNIFNGFERVPVNEKIPALNSI
jgi:hypothetical protein